MTFWRVLLVSSALFIASASHAQVSSTGVSVAGSNLLDASPSVWGASFYSLGSAPQQALEKGGASVFTYNYVGLNYKLSKSKRFSLRPVFQYTSTGKDRSGRDVKSDMVLGDAHFVYADYEIATLGPAEVSTSFKFYFPTSESSQANGMLLKFRPETFISLETGRFDSVTYSLKPDFYVQSRASNVDSFGKEKTTPVFVLEHALEYGASLNKTFTLKPSVGFIDSWYNPSQNPRIVSHKTEAKLALGLDIRAMKNLNFTLSAENKFAVTDRRDAVSFFRPEDNGLILITSASM